MLIRRPSDAHQVLIRCPSDAHQKLIRSSSDAHQVLIRSSSEAHQTPIRCSSEAHQMSEARQRPQRPITGEQPAEDGKLGCNQKQSGGHHKGEHLGEDGGLGRGRREQQGVGRCRGEKGRSGGSGGGGGGGGTAARRGRRRGRWHWCSACYSACRNRGGGWQRALPIPRALHSALARLCKEGRRDRLEVQLPIR